MVLWSTASIDSDYVNSEAGEAKRRNILFPVLIEPAELPMEFRRLQTADLTAWKARAKGGGFERLLESLTALLGPPDAPQVHPVSYPNPQIPWTNEQWAHANKVIQEQGSRARVAATFLPRVGSLPPEAQQADDMGMTQLLTLQVKEFVSNAEMAYPEASLRRAADALAGLEDAVVFRGLVANAAPPPFIPPAGLGGVRAPWEILNGEVSEGIFSQCSRRSWIRVKPEPPRGANLVTAVCQAIRHLKMQGEFGPFAVVLGDGLFEDVQTLIEKQVPPNDRIIALLGGGPLLNSLTLDVFGGYSGVVVPLGGSPVELVLGADVSLDVERVSDEPRFAFRVFEKMRVRIKRPEAIAILYAH